MIEEVKETIIERIGELAQEASPATLKLLAATLEIVDKVGREDPNEKYVSAMMELFKDMKERMSSNPLSDLKLPENFGLADISKSLNNQNAVEENKE